MFFLKGPHQAFLLSLQLVSNRRRLHTNKTVGASVGAKNCLNALCRNLETSVPDTMPCQVFRYLFRLETKIQNSLIFKKQKSINLNSQAFGHVTDCFMKYQGHSWGRICMDICIHIHMEWITHFHQNNLFQLEQWCWLAIWTSHLTRMVGDFILVYLGISCKGKSSDFSQHLS